jgi:hypothetical protein
MDRKIALYAAIANRYNTNAAFEGTSGHDSVHPQPPVGWSNANLLTQYIRFAQEVPAYYTRCNVWMGLDYMPGGNTAMETIIAACYANRCGVAQIDTWVNTSGNPNDDSSTDAQRVIIGMTWNGTLWVSGGTDYRGLINVRAIGAAPGWGGKEGPHTAQQTRDKWFSQGANHGIWRIKNFSWSQYATTELFWDNTQTYAVEPRYTPDERTYVRDSGPTNPTVTGCPTRYGGTCNL